MAQAELNDVDELKQAQSPPRPPSSFLRPTRFSREERSFFLPLRPPLVCLLSSLSPSTPTPLLRCPPADVSLAPPRVAR
jgi:hypothetical protein